MMTARKKPRRFPISQESSVAEHVAILYGWAFMIFGIMFGGRCRNSRYVGMSTPRWGGFVSHVGYRA